MTWLPLHFTPLVKIILKRFYLHLIKLYIYAIFGREVVDFGLPELKALEDPVIPHFIDYDYLYNNVGPYNREYFRKELGITEIEERENKKIF